MPDRDPPPRRRVVLELELGADSWHDAAYALQDIARCLLEADDQEKHEVHVTTGGPTWGGRYDATEDRDVTHESYHAANSEWLRKQREADDG